MPKSKLPKKSAPIKHKFVYAWGRYMGSKDYYINDQLKLADKENAPLNAIFRASNGEWTTLEAIEDPNLAAALTDYVKYLP